MAVAQMRGQGARAGTKTTATAMALDDTAGADGYSWEEEYKRSWDVLQEDEHGSLKNTIIKIKNQKRQRLVRDTETVQRGILRHVYVILDISANMAEKDMHPSRIDLTLKTMEAFILEYFDQNPISQLGIIMTKDGIAEKLTDLSGNPIDHLRVLRDKKVKDLSGDPSVQNALELAMHSLKQGPNQGSREILMVLGSLSTTDPSDINKTIAKAKESNIRISMVHLAAEVYVFKRICKETLGEFSVVMNEGHFRDLLFEFIPPPPVVREGDSRDGGPNQNAMVVMGFPTRVQGSVPTYCVCHYSLTLAGYQCPQCKSKVCEIPNDCDVCGLSLVASPHLARSYHHLFPIPTFIEQQQQQLPVGNSASSSGGGGAMDDGAVCFACLTRLADLQAETLSSSLDKQPNGGPGRDGGDQLPSGTTSRYQCPNCKHLFCIECDIFIHENLHNCPGCC